MNKLQLGSINRCSVAIIFEYDLMHWSSQMEEACDSLSVDAECEGDVILVAAARLTKIAVSAAEVSRRASDDHNTTKHAMMAIDPLILSLNNFKKSLPVEQLQHCKINVPSPLPALKFIQGFSSVSCRLPRLSPTILRS